MERFSDRQKSLALGFFAAVIFGAAFLRNIILKGNIWYSLGTIVLVLLVFYSVYSEAFQRRKFASTLRKYVAHYQIPIESLGEITGFDMYDFQLDTKNRVYFLYASKRKKAQQVLQRLEEKYGKLPESQTKDN